MGGVFVLQRQIPAAVLRTRLCETVNNHRDGIFFADPALQAVNS